MDNVKDGLALLAIAFIGDAANIFGWFAVFLGITQ